MKIKKWKRIIFAAALLAVLAISGISALFTDGDTMLNVFTVGKVDIKLLEPNWTPDATENAVLDITPRQEIAKDPQISNIGNNDAYVFMEVVVPYANITTVEDDGGNEVTADTPLFSYDVKDGWVQVGDAEKNTVLKTITRRYAYGTADAMTVLQKGTTSSTLFDYIRFANVVEDQGLETTSKDVVINAYAIQTDNINDGKILLDGNNADGKVKPADIWEVIFNQKLVDYTPLEYIESTGSQYINTGIMPSDDMVFEIEYQVMADTDSGQKLFGCEYRASSLFDAFNVKKASAAIRAFAHDGAGGHGVVTSISTNADQKTKLELEIENNTNKVSVNGVLIKEAAVLGAVPDLDIYLFAANRLNTSTGTNYADAPISARIYGCRIYKSGALVGDFRPCITPDGDVGMYNTVDKTYHLNKGTGNFIPEYYVLDNYVHDSANLILDGIWNSAEGVHSNTLEEGWVDLSGHCQPTPLGTTNTVGTNCITSDGTIDGRMTVPDVDPINLNTFTLELIYEKGGGESKNQAIMGRNYNTSYYVNTWDQNLTTWIGGIDKTVVAGLDYTAIHTLQVTCGITSATAWVDGVKTKENYTANATSTGDPLCLFGNASTSVCFNGSIMAVRIHNRILTDEELAHNYEVDKKRFGL